MLDRPLSLENKGLPRFASSDGAPAGWAVSAGYVPYPAAVAAMEARAAAIADGTAGELVWLLEHPPLYTAGVSAKPDDLLDAGRFPVFQSGRGGQYTYHGPGQRVSRGPSHRTGLRRQANHRRGPAAHFRGRADAGARRRPWKFHARL